MSTLPLSVPSYRRRWSAANQTLSLGGVASLSITKTADVLTTILALELVPRIHEANGVAAFFGAGDPVPTLILGGVILAGVVGVTEAAARLIRRLDSRRWLPAAVRVGAYAPLTILWSVTAVHNARLLLEVMA